MTTTLGRSMRMCSHLTSRNAVPSQPSTYDNGPIARLHSRPVIRSRLDCRTAAALIDLAPRANNVGTTTPANLGDGQLNVWRNSFPSSAMPSGPTVADVGGVPFRIPATGDGRPDNVRCAG